MNHTLAPIHCESVCFIALQKEAEFTMDGEGRQHVVYKPDGGTWAVQQFACYNACPIQELLEARTFTSPPKIHLLGTHILVSCEALAKEFVCCFQKKSEGSTLQQGCLLAYASFSPEEHAINSVQTRGTVKTSGCTMGIGKNR